MREPAHSHARELRRGHPEEADLGLREASRLPGNGETVTAPPSSAERPSVAGAQEACPLPARTGAAPCGSARACSARTGAIRAERLIRPAGASTSTAERRQQDRVRGANQALTAAEVPSTLPCASSACTCT